MASYRVVWVIREQRECNIEADSFEQAKQKWEMGVGDEIIESTVYDDIWLIENESGKQVIYNDIF